MYIYPTLMISPLITISCNSWFSIWMMMELNMMTFIPLIIFLNKKFKELSFKYFIVQTISSSIFILSANITFINNNIWINLFMNFSLLMKLGFPPFQFWFISMMNNMNWLNCLILSTWQKIIPMILLMNIYILSMNLILIIYASIMSSMLSLNHTSLRIILSFSSINHMSWMILNLMISEMMWLMYFLIYLISNSSIILIFNYYKIFYINQLYIMNKMKNFKLVMFMNLMSICGLPPMLGFNMKWLSMYFYSMNNFYIMNFIIIMMSILTFIFYTRITIMMMTLNTLKNKLNLKFKFKNLNLIMIMMFLSFMNLWLISIWLF